MTTDLRYPIGKARMEARLGADARREMIDPDLGVLSLDQLLGMYSWHGRHHTAHVTWLRERMGWG
jgi:hypothetical protein